MQTDAFVKISFILQCQKIPEGIRIRLENFFTNWKHHKTLSEVSVPKKP